jgi:hypothetical protein
MVVYRHTQWGWFGVPTLALFVVVLGAVVSDDAVSTTMVAAVAALMAAILGVVLYFSRLTVSVDGARVVAAFGYGWPRRVFDAADITAVRPVKNKWWYGFGIRRLSRGWMYNVWGLDGVELELSSGTVFRIGTDEPDVLASIVSLMVRS